VKGLKLRRLSGSLDQAGAPGWAPAGVGGWAAVAAARWGGGPPGGSRRATMRISRAFGDGLFELRPRGRTGIGRAFYCYLVGKRVVVLHAFIKKSQQTPDSELKLARKRLKEVQHG
jgi:Phage derived protein Gp49-like (DUF891)